MSLKKKALGGVLWTLGQQMSVQGINFLVQIMLARLLLPEAFGLIAMIQIFLAIGTALMDSGMTSSLIRTREADQRDYSTVFFMNICSSVFLYAIVYFSAPVISVFFEQPQLILIIRVYCTSFIIQALVAVQSTRLTKEMNFKLQMYMQIPASIFGGLTGVLLAYNGFGVWSLVWMHIITTFLFMIQHWFRTEWKPTLVFDKAKFRYHFNFGYKITFSALLTTLYTNSYTLIIAKMFSVSQLGFYNQADTLRMFPVKNLTTALQKVTFPLFSAIQNDNERLRTVFAKITALVFFIVYPVMLVLFIVAEPLFRIVLTEKWVPAVPYFRFLCIIAIVYPISMYNLNVILAKGRSDLHLKLEFWKKGCSILSLFLIIPYGIWGVIYASAISMLIHASFNAYFSGKLMNYSILNQFKDIAPIIFVGGSALCIVLAINSLFLGGYLINDFAIVASSTAIYMTLYILISLLVRIPAVFEVKQILNLIKDR